MAFNYEYPYTDPNFYNDDWLLKRMKDLLAELAKLEDWIASHEKEYEQLKSLYDSLMAGAFPPEIVTAFNNWAKANLPSLLKEAVKSVWFGLTDDGYFFAYIPDSWAGIIFNTSDLDIFIPGVDYGHLVLSFEAEEE